MKIGILSDTHGNVTRTREALKILARHNVGAIVHCGDIGSMQCLMLLAESAPRVYAVAGNTDAHQADHFSLGIAKARMLVTTVQLSPSGKVNASSTV